ncbi:hypothetical protein EDB85DRAFT_1990383 [Lactarius pseudohatsudake]|nr:hypothetical protein EDB85DRAFT_1990383 [Lactarius pseudohatsudake]
MSPSFYLVSSGHQLQDRLQPTYLLFVQCSENSRWFSSQSQIWNFEADGSRRSARTPSLAAALAPSRPLHSATLSVANTVYDGFRPATPFLALGGALKALVLVLAPDVDVAHARAVVRRTRKFRCGARASRAVSSDEVRLAESTVEAGQLAVAERAGASHAPPAGHAGDRGPSRLALWR